MSATTVRQQPHPPATLADLLALPDEGQGYELIDGALVPKESSGEHAGAQAALLGTLFPPFSRQPGGGRPGGWGFAAEALVDFGTRKFRPDVAGWRREKVPARPAGTLVTAIPDWICEVLSPWNASNDTVTKMHAYQQAQVGHYWLLDPVDETLSVYRWTKDGYLHVLGARRSDRVRAEPFDAIELQVGVFFGDDEEDGPPAAG